VNSHPVPLFFSSVKLFAFDKHKATVVLSINYAQIRSVSIIFALSISLISFNFVQALAMFTHAFKLCCDLRFQQAFTGCGCALKVVTLDGSNKVITLKTQLEAESSCRNAALIINAFS